MIELFHLFTLHQNKTVYLLSLKLLISMFTLILRKSFCYKNYYISLLLGVQEVLTFEFSMEDNVFLEI